MITPSASRAPGRIGQKTKNNGAILFVFIQDAKCFCKSATAWKASLPDALCKQITEYEIKPRFKAGDYAGGLTAGVNAILAATRHEYKGTGATVYEQKHHGGGPNPAILVWLFPGLFILSDCFSLAAPEDTVG